MVLAGEGLIWNQRFGLHELAPLDQREKNTRAQNTSGISDASIVDIVMDWEMR